jgi:N-acetylmuramic acid 6-phosphate etherase
MAGGMEALYQSTEASEDDQEAGARDLASHGFNARDALVGIAASGRTPYVMGAIRAARQMGAATAGISCTPDSELSRAVDYPIAPTPGPEIVSGSTRLKAGTATKLVLNMISTGVMIRLGYVYGNLMVNVLPGNEKLVDRARRVISAAARISYERSGELLEASGRKVPVAIMMAKLNVTREEAERRLANAHGRLRAAMGEEGAQQRP